MRRVVAFLVLIAAMTGYGAVSRAQTAEDLVKATFLYRFASFVSWPDGAFADEQTPIRICVIGSEPLANQLTRAAANQHVNGRAFEVRQLASANAVDECNIAYVVGDRAGDVMRETYAHPVLTVTDGEVDRGSVRGIIHFVIVDRRVRFYIDDAHAAESHLNIDPRLLGLAVSVRRRTGS
ncbi:MAG: YfiR family protein [Terricaulis sp.]